MAIRVVCGGCGKGIKAAVEYAGRRARCPGCGTAIEIPPVEQNFGAADSPPQPPPPPPRAVTPAAAPVAAAPVAASPVARAAVDHTHRAKGSFSTGFGVAMGCLVAVGVLCMGGCVVMLIVGGTALMGASEVVQQVDQAIQEAEAEHHAELEARAAQMAPYLAEVAITEPRLDSRDFGGNVVSAIFTNHSDRTVASIEVEARYATAGRELPWAEGKLTFSFRGGLEPGETRTAAGVGRGIVDPFEYTEIRPDAVLSLVAVDIEVPSLTVPAAEK